MILGLMNGILAPPRQQAVQTFPSILGAGSGFTTMGQYEYSRKLMDLTVPAGANLLVVVCYSVGAGWPNQVYRIRNGVPSAMFDVSGFVAQHTNLFYLKNPEETNGFSDAIWFDDPTGDGFDGAGGYACVAGVDVSGDPVRAAYHDEDLTPAELAGSVNTLAGDLVLDTPGLYSVLATTDGTPGAGETRRLQVMHSGLACGIDMATKGAVSANTSIGWTFTDPANACCYRGWSLKKAA